MRPLHYVVPGADRHGGTPGLSRAENAGVRFSTHELGIAEVIELARILGHLPARVTLYGIEVADCTLGGPMSAEVLKAIQELAAEISVRTMQDRRSPDVLPRGDHSHPQPK